MGLRKLLFRPSGFLFAFDGLDAGSTDLRLSGAGGSLHHQGLFLYRKGLQYGPSLMRAVAR